MEVENEQIIPLWADHRNMCRFEGSRNKEYCIVSSVIQSLARKALANNRIAMKADRISSNRCMYNHTSNQSNPAK